ESAGESGEGEEGPHLRPPRGGGIASPRGGGLLAVGDFGRNPNKSVAAAADSPPTPLLPSPLKTLSIPPKMTTRDWSRTRRYSGSSVITKAPTMAPARLPMPPTATMSRTSMDFQKVKSFGFK